MLPEQACHSCGSKLFSNSFMGCSSSRIGDSEKGSQNAKMEVQSKPNQYKEEEENPVITRHYHCIFYLLPVEK